MRHAYNLVAIKITEKEENMVELEYYTADGKQPIVKINVEKSELPLNLGKELSKEEYTALLQLLLTPYGHLNLLERWLNWAARRIKDPTAFALYIDVQRERTGGIELEDLITDTERLIGLPKK